jgi:predicted alpha-1,2-mannosidase
LTFSKANITPNMTVLRSFSKLAFFAILLGLSNALSDKCATLLSKTDPMNGSGGLGYGYGSINPGSSFPRGAMRLGPDTTKSVANAGFEHFSGYDYIDSKIRMMSHTHFVGAGINGLGNFGVMPTKHKKAKKHRGGGLSFMSNKSAKEYEAWRILDPWSSKFQKENEKASPGHYSVLLDEHNIQADLIATSGFTAMHKYSFLEDADKDHEKSLVFDVCHSSHTERELPLSKSVCEDSLLIINEDGTFDAYVQNNGVSDMWLHGEIEVVGDENQKLEWLVCSNGDDKNKVKCNDGFSAGSTGTQSTNGILLSQITFNNNNIKEIKIHVGLSLISSDMAKQNLHTSDVYKYQKSFHDSLEMTQNIWCQELSYFDINATSPEMEKMLYSASYRSRLTPAIYSEAGGLYYGFDGKNHNVNEERGEIYSCNASVPEGKFYSDYSLWDTFRTQNPFLFLTDEPMYIGVLRSFGEITKQQGAFPKWTTGNHDNGCMMGLAGAAGVLEAGLAGYNQKHFDINSIQKSLQEIATTNNSPKNGRADVAHYMKYGYVSSEAQNKGSSYTVTYAYDDAILAGISDIIGKTEDAKTAHERSMNYKKIFDQDNLIICPRSEKNGPMSCPKKPQEDFKHYTEGNALHWTYFVPHDIKGLISLYPSNDIFEKRLDDFFENHIKFQMIYGALLPNPYFWAGNEPTMLTPYIFTYLKTSKGCAKTQYWTRKAIDMHFSEKYNGIPGNDDYAAMSSWVIFSSIGIYPLSGTSKFFITSPAINSGSILLKRFQGSTGKLTIKVNGNDNKDAVYIQKLLVNGKEWTSPMIERADLVNSDNTILEYFMGSEPTTSLCQQ